MAAFRNPGPWLDLDDLVEGGVAVALFQVTGGLDERGRPAGPVAGQALLGSGLGGQPGEIERDRFGWSRQLQVLQA